jgi:RNA polymerase sigma-70 factor (ECF subfamily)
MLDNALSQLNEIQRSAILLRDYEGYSYSEIGEILEINESQVKIQIFRGRKKLQNIIGNVEDIL